MPSRPDRHCEPTRTVWWRETDDGYAIEVRFGARIARKASGHGSREDCLAKCRELADEFQCEEINEERV